MLSAISFFSNFVIYLFIYFLSSHCKAKRSSILVRGYKAQASLISYLNSKNNNNNNNNKEEGRGKTRLGYVIILFGLLMYSLFVWNRLTNKILNTVIFLQLATIIYLFFPC